MARSIFVVVFILFSFPLLSQENYSLAKCLKVGLKNNINLNISSLDVRQNELSLTQSKASLLPNLNASASHGYNWGQTIDPFTNQFATNRIQSNSFGVNTGVTLFSGLVLQNRIKQADLNLKISQLGLENNRNTIALAIANSYLTVLFNKEFSVANRANLASSQEQLDRIQLLVNAGQLPEANLYQAQAQVASDEARLISTENAIDISLLNLMQLIQLSEEDRVGFDIVSPELAEPSDLLPAKENLLNHALTNFPEIKSAELGKLNADLSYKIANGNRMPRLAASFNYGSGFSGARQSPLGDPTFSFQEIGIVQGTTDLVVAPVPSYSSFETVPFFDQLESNVNRSLFFSLNVPIFNGLSNSTNVQMAKIGKENADLNMRNVQNQLTQSIESAYADANAANKTYVAADLAHKSQQEAFKYAKIRYEQQALNGMDFAQARSARDAALAEKIRAQYDFVFKTKILEFYQGKAITLD